MKTKLGIGIILLAALVASAQTNNLTALLQQGLFEEQANRNLDAAIENYAVLARQFDKDRQIAATAVFRLGECYRAQGKTNEAAAQYQRILRDFADQKTLVTLSQQNLAGMGAGRDKTGTAENSKVQLWNKLKDLRGPELESILPTLVADATLNDLLQKRNEAQQNLATLGVDLATNNPVVVKVKAVVEELNRQIGEKISGVMQGLKMQAELSQVEHPVIRSDLPELSTHANSEEDQEIARIKQMIQNSPDLINGNPIQGSPLGRAAEAGQLRVATFLLDNGADVNAPHFTAGKTALIVAANAGQKAMVELLLQHGAKINATDNQNQTALHLAVEQGFLGVTEVLLNAKADPNQLNADIQTPLLIAAKKGSVPLATLLLAHGADPNIARKVRPSYGTNPVEEGRKMFGTPLHLAAARGDKEMVALLLTNRADVKALSIYDETPLQVAAACGREDVAELLLAAGANPDARSDADSGTPLHLATASGFRNIVEKLLAHGANPNTTAKFGRLGVTPLMLAASGGNNDIAQLLLQHKASPNLKDQEGNTALINAINAKQAAVVKTLLAHGADPETKSGEWPALMMAAGRNSPEMTLALIEAKADVNEAAGADRKTALHAAAYYGNVEIVKILLDAHASVNACSANGDTPLHQAVRGGRDEIVSLLLDAKADPNARNNYGVTPLDLTKEIKTPPLPGGTLTLGSRPALHGTLANQPLTYQWGNGEPAQSNAPVSIADLLRQHGALDELPDFTRIRVTRQGLVQPLEVFQAGANLTNQFTLLETVMRFYSREIWINGMGRAAWEGLPFPDFGRIIIRRPSPKIGGKETEIKVSLLNSSNQVDCALDVPVKFGDVIEIPESVHALNAKTPNPVQELEVALWVNHPAIVGFPNESEVEKLKSERAAKQCLQKTVKLVVAGETTTFKVNSWREGFLSQALSKTEARSVLRSSSDLSRVKVTRPAGQAAKPLVFIVDASGNGAGRDDLWLQDGDVIEVPEKK